MKKFLLALAVAISVCLVFGTAFAASSKVAMQCNNVVVMKQAQGDYQKWTPVLTSTLHMPSNQSILITPSFETGLYTDTAVTGKNGSTSTATAIAGIRVRCKLTDSSGNVSYAIPSAPGQQGVIYDYRQQQLSATLGGVINLSSCGFDPVTGLFNCTVTPEMIDLLLNTMSAHSFTFIYPNVSAGDYTVTCEALIDCTTTDTVSDPTLATANATAYASIGLGSLTVEQVGLVNIGTPLTPQ